MKSRDSNSRMGSIVAWGARIAAFAVKSSMRTLNFASAQTLASCAIAAKRGVVSIRSSANSAAFTGANASSRSSTSIVSMRPASPSSIVVSARSSRPAELRRPPRRRSTTQCASGASAAIRTYPSRPLERTTPMTPAVDWLWMKSPKRVDVTLSSVTSTFSLVSSRRLVDISRDARSKTTSSIGNRR